MTPNSNINQSELGNVIRGMTPAVKTDPRINQAELGKVIRVMQNDSDNKSRMAQQFNQAAANVVKQGVMDKKK